jgi:hypothetical protein
MAYPWTVHRGLPLAAAATAIIVVLLIPATNDASRRDAGIRVAAAELRGEGPNSDVAAEYVGARAVTAREDPYPVLGPAFQRVGLDWDVRHRSPHPPSTILLVLPLSWLDYPAFLAVWAWLMLGAIAVSLWALGLRAAWAPLAAVGLLAWQPASWSLGQLTAVWLLGVSLAWRWRDRPGWAGTAIGVAAATKFFGALVLLPFLIQRRWRAAVGFVSVTAALSVVLLVQEAISGDGLISRYLDVGRKTASEQMRRLDNAALMRVAVDRVGLLGALAFLALVGAVLATAVLRRSLDRHTFGACTWASVALLPIAWVYSALPMIPALIAAWRGPLVSRLLAIAFVAVYVAVTPFGAVHVVPMAAATAGLGVAVLLATPGGILWWRSRGAAAVVAGTVGPEEPSQH